ncbi:MAG: hypothetical protein RLZZ488_2537 [Pseudomonadota bacterium]|jgi:S1-C subfamily serine protease
MRKNSLQRLFGGLLTAVPLVGIALAGAPNATAENSTSHSSAGNAVAGGELETRAAAGDPKASYLLGLRYFLGDQIARNRNMAKHYLTRAAEAGEVRAMNMLGLMSDPLWSDDAAAKDLPTAVAWYRRAAALGYDPALNNLTELKKRGYIKSELENGLPLALGSGQIQPVVTAQPPQPDASKIQQAVPTPASAGPAAVAGAAEIQPTGHTTSTSVSIDLPALKEMDGREMFKARSSALVEILGDGNYGSGVILGSLWNRSEDAILRTHLQDLQVSYPFVAGGNGSSDDTSLPLGSYLVVVSNAHVMEGIRVMEIGYGVDQRGQTLFKKPLAGVCFPTESNVDLAVYFVPIDPSELTLNGAISFAPLPAAATIPETGSRVFAIANPERMARSIAQGLLSGLRPDLIQFDAPISKGSSGGAVFDERGNLLGIIFGYLNEAGAQNLNFAIPADRIRPLMMGSGALCYRASQSGEPIPAAEKKPQ